MKLVQLIMCKGVIYVAAFTRYCANFLRCTHVFSAIWAEYGLWLTRCFRSENIGMKAFLFHASITLSNFHLVIQRCCLAKYGGEMNQSSGHKISMNIVFPH